jgi:NADPH2:quinone reductase
VDAIAPGEGDTVLAVGATGGVGSFFVQLAAGRGARVISICSEGNTDYARRLGASGVIDYAVGDAADQVRSRFPDGIDAIGVMFGDADSIAKLSEQVRKGGRVASAVGGVDIEALEAGGIEGTNVYGRVTTESLERITQMIEAGKIVFPELRSFAFGDAGEALEAIATGHTRGKIVVTIV